MSEILDEDDIQNIVRSELRDAEDYIESEIGPNRAEATRYYRGDPFGDELEGQSRIVSMDLRDSTQAILPSLMRMFFGSNSVVEFAPRGPEDVLTAKAATDYVNFIVSRDNDGFAVGYDAFKDALIRKAGFIKAWEETEESEPRIVQADEAGLIQLAAQNVEITRLEEFAEGEFSVTVVDSPTPRIRIQAIPPEELLISRNARSWYDTDVIAHSRPVTASDLVEMGYDMEEIRDYLGKGSRREWNQEAIERNEYDRRYGSTTDDSQQRVLYTEAYFHIDEDGDGIAELRKICCLGEEFDIVDDEVVSRVPIAFFEMDPEPHTPFGLSMFDITKDIQRVKSLVLRSSLDSLAQSVRPRTAIVEGQASLADVLNNEVGGIVRMQSRGAVEQMVTPYVGKEAFPMLDYLDQVRENRTGVSKAAEGLDASALQSSTASAVEQTISAAQQRTELIARHLAVGMRQLFEIIYELIREGDHGQRIVQLKSGYQAVDPSQWGEMDVVINVALGKGTEQERLAGLSLILQKQEQFLTQLGVDNPLVSPEQFYNTLTDMLDLMGHKDPTKYFSDPSGYQPPPPQPGLDEQLVQVENAKVQTTHERELLKLKMEDDRKRDESEVDAFLKAKEIEAKYGVQIAQVELKAIVDRERNAMGAMNVPPSQA